MRNKETRKERIINSMEMVETSFKLLLDKRQVDELNKGIYLLLGKFGNSEVTELFDRYPRLIQKYSSRELFSGNIEIPDIDSANLKIAGLLTYLQFLISSIPDFTDQSGHIIPADEIKNDRSYQAEHYIINSIPLDEYIEHLFLTVVSATGEEYYRKFIEKTGNPDFTIDGGSLSESWRQQPDTPAYCRDLGKEALAAALEEADPGKRTQYLEMADEAIRPFL